MFDQRIWYAVSLSSGLYLLNDDNTPFLSMNEEGAQRRLALYLTSAHSTTNDTEYTCRVLPVRLSIARTA